MYAISFTISLLCLFAACQCIPTYGSSDFAGYGGGSSSSYGSHEEEHQEPKPYAFGYSVKDFKKGTNFNQHESSDGHTIKGQYAVALPDGRMQIVSYNADWKNGYHADVKYVGEAHHPELYATSNYGHDTGAGSGYESSYGGGHASSTNFQSLGAAGSHGSYGGDYSGHQAYRK